MDNKQTTIVAAYHAMGKTEYCNKYNDVDGKTMLDIPLNEYKYEKNSDGSISRLLNTHYTTDILSVIDENIGKYDFIFITADKNICELLNMEGIPYITIIPETVEQVAVRLLSRGNITPEIAEENKKILDSFNNDKEYLQMYNKMTYITNDTIENILDLHFNDNELEIVTEDRIVSSEEADMLSRSIGVQSMFRSNTLLERIATARELLDEEQPISMVLPENILNVSKNKRVVVRPLKVRNKNEGNVSKSLGFFDI